VGTDTSAVVSGAPGLSTTAVAGSNAGTYPIAITAGNLSAANYSFTLAGGTLTVNKAVLTVTADDKSKTYGDVNPDLTYKITGFKLNDNQNNSTSAPHPEHHRDADSATSAPTASRSTPTRSRRQLQLRRQQRRLTIDKAMPPSWSTATAAPYDGDAHGATGSPRACRMRISPAC
jgi:hypothetical protein